MNPTQLNFAYKVRHALNENLENLPDTTVARLAAARKMALARKKKDSPLRVLLTRPALATGTGVFSQPTGWLTRMGLVIPMVALVAGLIGIYQFEKEQRISEIAEIDAGVLTDELPLSAYLDHGFNAYLANRGD